MLKKYPSPWAKAYRSIRVVARNDVDYSKACALLTVPSKFANFLLENIKHWLKIMTCQTEPEPQFRRHSIVQDQLED